jgi:hypothetical protein
LLAIRTFPKNKELSLNSQWRLAISLLECMYIILYLV